MRRFKIISFVVSVLLFSFGFSDIIYSISSEGTNGHGTQDSILLRQLLYNGREWKNTKTTIAGDPFLFPILTGSVTISGMTFENNKMFYDIYRDEVLILSDQNVIIQLNKELVEKFVLPYNNVVYRFVNFKLDTTSLLNDYVNELYNGKSAVYVKYRKVIQERAIDDKYDGYIESYKIYVMKDGLPHQVKNRKQLLDLMKDKKQMITAFIRSHKLVLTWKQPESFVPVAEYYDSLSR